MAIKTPDPIIGRILGDFLVKEKLGEGGFGAVYRAQQITLDRPAVIKVLHANHRANIEVIERFRREAHLASRLEHPYTAHIYAFGVESDGLMWIAMELIQGTPLNKLIKIQGPIVLERFVDLLDKICEVVHTAHELGIVHRDIKPANIMMIIRAGRLLPKLLDFGIAKAFNQNLTLDKSINIPTGKNSTLNDGLIYSQDNNFNNFAPKEKPDAVINQEDGEVITKTKSEKDPLKTIDTQKHQEDKETKDLLEPTKTTLLKKQESEIVKTERVIGSPMSSEQIENTTKADVCSDIYSLGVLAYQLLTGELPLKDSKLSLIPVYSSKLLLLDVIAKAMAKDPKDRYQTALEFAKEFRKAAGFSKEIILPKLDEILKESTVNTPKSLVGSEASSKKQETYVVRTEGIIGSPAYMSPEQIENSTKVDARSDIYSLGVLAYQLLTGELPFKGSAFVLMAAHLNELVPSLGKGFTPLLDSVIAKAMAKDPKDRYQTALEFAKEFRKAAGLIEAITMPQLDELLRENILANAPKPLANTVANLIAARNVYQFKDRALFLFRVLVHYIGILSLASYGRANTGQQNNDLINKTIVKLRQQGLSNSQWIELSRELCRFFAKDRDIYPIPELVSLFFVPDSEQLSSTTETFTKLLQLEQELYSSALLKEEELSNLLTNFLAKLTKLLNITSWLSDYYLVLPKGQQATKWMGAVKEISTIMLKNKNLSDGKAVLVDPNGYFVLSLWPLIEISSPTPGAYQEVFLFESKGRSSAKLVSFPDGFEIETESPWQWFKENFVIGEEKEKTATFLEKSPYLGLATFSPADSALFLGREKETESFLNRLRVQSLLIVAGPSGAGKSSFIQAGIVARLDENWQVITLRPGLSPLITLARKLSTIGIEVSDLKDNLKKDINFLYKILQKFTRKENKTLLLIVDQFEEILTLCLDKEEQHLYVEAIISSAQSEEDLLRVILTVRDDFLFRVKDFRGLKDRLAQSLELLTTPGSSQLLRILIEPAKRTGYEFEDQELPVEIVNKLTEQTSALPLLAFTAAKLWEQRDKEFKQLRRRSYEAMGGVGGALARHAEEVMEQMTQKEQTLVREAFQHLVTSENTRAILTRLELSQLLGKTADSEALIEKLILARLLVSTEGEKGIDRIEVVHEALLSAWPRLAKWRQEITEGARLKEQLRAATRQWNEHSKTKGLLWRDEILIEYQVWKERYKGKLTDIEEEFINTSLLESSRSQRIKKTLVLTTIIVLIVGSAVMFYQRQQTKKQLFQTLELYEEQGRQEMLKGNVEGAAVYLSEAYAKGANSLALRYMLSVALAALEKHSSVTLDNHRDAVTFAVFSPDDTLVATSSRDKTARIWQAIDGKELFILRHDREVISIDFSANGKLLVTASLDKTAKLWKVIDGSLVTTLSGHNDWLQGAKFSPDGKKIATISYDKTAKIWDGSNGKLIHTLKRHQGIIYALSFSKNGKWLATAGADKVVNIWDIENGELKTTLTGHKSSIVSVEFSPDSKLIVTGSTDTTAKIWEVAESKLLATLTGHKASITDTKFSPDGKNILTTSGDKTACIWDTIGNLVYTLSTHKADIQTGGFSPDSKLIITNSYDKTTRVWERDTGKFLVVLAEHQNSLNSGVFSSNGEKILTASEDKTSKIWSLVPEERAYEQVLKIVNTKSSVYLKDGRLEVKTQLTNKQPEKLSENYQKNQKNQKNTNAIYEIESVDETKIEMVKIEGGDFEMGSPTTDKLRNGDETLHQVTLSPFYMSKYEVTQAQWKTVAALPKINRVLSINPSYFQGDELPVENVDWYEVVEFCARLSKQTGKTYRLPTEAEWEYAARAGTKGSYYSEKIDDIAWYQDNSDKTTHPVGKKSPNKWGLYDMCGNVFEWCLDSYADYPSEKTIDPKVLNSGIYRIARGGGWFYPENLCRLAFRVANTPETRHEYAGFRIIREIK
ncbi:MAG: SUMF1/EgtB/PvdO family nonheme iron enzyme [Acidobacteria bacterium]|nr:SUMF1/EgtB/PvdO family nonheme iron enzyme [Acidobacteriota bacterium]